MSAPPPPRQSSARPRRGAGNDAVLTVRRRVMRGGLALVFVLSVVDGVFGARGLIENMALRQRNARVAATIDEFKQGNAALIDEIKRLREDPAAIEELARDELELMKDGELLIILRDVPAASSPTSTAKDTRVAR